MRLMRVGEAGSERPVVVVPESPGSALQVDSIVGDLDAAFFAGDGITRLRGALEGRSGLPVVDLAGVRRGPPIARPGKIICVGLNYEDHARETGVELPDEPPLFMKAPNTVVGPDDEVIIPPGSEKTDWEIELGVVVGRVVRRETPEQAVSAIAGLVISNDLSERHYQLERGGQWDKGKSCDTFNPLGPLLVTPDEFTWPLALSMQLLVNGKLLQDSNTSSLAVDVPGLLSYISTFMTLEPGDLVNTGTPAGVGLGLDPPRYLKPGDTMELTIEGLGTQRQVCRAADDAI